MKLTDLNFLKTTIFIFLFTGINALAPALAQEKDRKVDQDKVKKFQQDDDFSYAATFEVSDDPLERFWRWVKEQFYRFLNSATRSGSPQQIIVIILFSAVLIFALFKLLGLDSTFGLYRNSKGKAGEKGIGVIDDIQGINFPELIASAYENKDYREVVRSYYLYALNRFDHLGLIQWKKGKTNYEYLDELTDSANQHEVTDNFSSLNHYFEYAVYGEFEVSESLAKSSESLFQEIDQAIS